MNFLCPSCRTPLPRGEAQQLTCTQCGVSVDVSRVETAPGQARLWPEVDLSGEALGGYALLKLLGSGGMGTVYEARAGDGSSVAVKVLAPLLAAEPALRERFRREARALATLSHPGVVKMLAEGEERGFCWYAMELVEGVDLRKRLERGPLTGEEALALARAALEALEAVHGAGFIHRDVKPSNLLLAQGAVKLCDFGIARVEGASTLTESAAVLGSLRYMAPEQRWGKCDERSDLYALGVVLHEALALGVPGERALPSHTPRALTRLIARLTEASPARRPESAAAARRLLARAPSIAVRVAAAIVVLGALGVGVSLTLRERQSEHPAMDRGSPLLAAGLVPDAGTGAAPATVESFDAGVSAATLPALAETVANDAGLVAETAALLVAEPAALDAGPPPARGAKGPKVKGLSVKPKVEPLPPPGVLSVQGSGRAWVSIRGVRQGFAPGTFRTAFGTFPVRVGCIPLRKSKRKSLVFDFQVSLSGEDPEKELTYECPADG